MRKNLIASFAVIISVILACTASADIISPGSVRRRYEGPAAQFILYPSESKADALELTIDAETIGKYSYEFAKLSGDVKEIVNTSIDTCDKGKYTYTLLFTSPKEGQILHYTLDATFRPYFDDYDTSPIFFSRKITVSKVDGIIHVAIED